MVAGALGWLLLKYADPGAGAQPLPLTHATVDIWPEHGRAVNHEQVDRLPPEAWSRVEQPTLRWPDGEAMWLRVTLRNPEDREWRGVLADADFFLDRIDAWTKEPASAPGFGGATWIHAWSGEAVAARENRSRAARSRCRCGVGPWLTASVLS